MLKQIYIDTDDALKLWIAGWCWNAIAEKYDCAGSTVKSRLDVDIRDEYREEHGKNHKRCPYCHKPKISKNQLSLI